MKESMWGYLLITLGLVIITIIVFIQNLTSTHEEDFYLDREIVESSMIDAIDYGSFKSTGKLVMSKEKFVEVFIRRFAESVSGAKDYTIEFYDISENPPKASVRILTNTGEANIKTGTFDLDVNTYLTGVLETTPDYNTKRSTNCREVAEPNCKGNTNCAVVCSPTLN